MNIPCSHVGHVFRTRLYWKGQVYPVPGEEIHRNKLRAAKAWMDDIPKVKDIRFVGPYSDVACDTGLMEFFGDSQKTFKDFVEETPRVLETVQLMRSSRKSFTICSDFLVKKVGAFGIGIEEYSANHNLFNMYASHASFFRKHSVSFEEFSVDSRGMMEWATSGSEMDFKEFQKMIEFSDFSFCFPESPEALFDWATHKILYSVVIAVRVHQFGVADFNHAS